MDRAETLDCVAAAYARALTEEELSPGSFYAETGLDEDAMVEQLFKFGRSLSEPLGVTDRSFAVGSVVAVGMRLGYYLAQAVEERD
jgi:hypothetical protein